MNVIKTVKVGNRGGNFALWLLLLLISVILMWVELKTDPPIHPTIALWQIGNFSKLWNRPSFGKIPESTSWIVCGFRIFDQNRSKHPRRLKDFYEQGLHHQKSIYDF